MDRFTNVTHSNASGTYLSLLLGSLLFLCACAPQRNNPLSNNYHNLTAHFNAYFIAKEHIRVVEEELYDNYEWNYNKILPIHVPFDSTDTAVYKDQMLDCIQKASIAIQRHPGSNWEYLSYHLVGMARLYLLEFPAAIETFKYVNTKSESNDERHESLIQLMRTFAKYGEFKNAIAVSDYLGREELDDEHAAYYYLNKAYIYQLQDNMDNMVKNLVLAEEKIPSHRDKARIQFIIGQVYQELGFNGLAFNYYKKCLRSSPTYNLSFYTKLYMAQVTELTANRDVKRTRKYFKKLLNDTKNREYRDKIYYEMGAFEQKNNNLDLAIEYYRSSVKVSENNQRQKGLSFLRLGQIHFDSLKAYKQAKYYYDSTIQVLPKDEDNYVGIKNRQEILGEFVKHITTIQENDSLLILAGLPEDSLVTLAQEQIALQQEMAKKAQEERKVNRQEAEQTRLQVEAALIKTGEESSGWYFSNRSSMDQGLITFRRIWGNRELQDNWRRSVKSALQFTTNQTSMVEDSVSKSSFLANDSLQTQQAVDALLSRIPKSDEAKQKLLSEVATAYYEVGNIYNFRLNEPKDATETFETLLRRFPDSTYEPEVLYQLYLLYKEVNFAQSKAKAQTLVNKYPESIYAKLINNPNYREESFALSIQLQKVYNRAYRLYDAEDYPASIALLDSALTLHPENVFSARLALLRAIITGHLEGQLKYQMALDRFIEQYDKSELVEYAVSLIESSEAFKARQISSAKARYIKFFDQRHYFVLVYPNKGTLSSELPSEVDQFLLKNNWSFPSGNLLLSDEYSMVVVNNLPDKGLAMEILTTFNRQKENFTNLKGRKHFVFVLSQDNFDIMYRTKDVDSYNQFFQQHYL